MIWRTAMLAVFGFLAAMLVKYSLAHDGPPDLVNAHVDRVIDGDSVEVTASIWIDQTVKASVRLRGIDAPELHGKCPAERWAGLQAKEWLKAAIEGHDVDLTELGTEKFGRVLARVAFDGRDIAEEMLGAGLVRPYEGEARKGWC